MDLANMYALLVQGNGFLSGGGDLADPTSWGAWAHQGHRLWASMSEEFWVYVYKVRRCPQPCSHDWTACPYAHMGERARRRDPRRFTYAAVSCPEYRALAQAMLAGGIGPQPPGCARGLKCRYAHGVFELWLHPSRFRTRMCEAGPRCTRKICFFAHFASELRADVHIAAASVRTLPLPMISLPQSPPVMLQRAPSPPPASPPPAAVPRDQPLDDVTLQAAADRLRLLNLYSAFAADTLYSSAATAAAAAAAAATVPTLMALPADDGDEDVKSGRCAEEEDSVSVVSDYQYQHFDLIMDLVS